jgi:microcystin degradation protein MlrC
MVITAIAPSLPGFFYREAKALCGQRAGYGGAGSTAGFPPVLFMLPELGVSYFVYSTNSPAIQAPPDSYVIIGRMPELFPVKKRLRIATGGILHETNTFAPSITGLDSFRQMGILHGVELNSHQGAPTALGGILDGLQDAGYETIPLIYASAMPSGTVSAVAYQSLCWETLQALEDALPVDGVLLALHGAMVAENQLDCEGDLLERLRHLVGPGCPILATLDMHGNVSPKMVQNADVLVAYHTNPHQDARQRGLELVGMLARLLRDKITPVSVLAHPPLLLSALATWTSQRPLSEVHQAARKHESDPRVLNISVMGGFAYADTPYSGVSLVVTTREDRRLAQQIADELADVAWQFRQEAGYKGVPPQMAVREALAAPEKPVVLADVGDNVGGGTPGDGTVLLKALLEANATEAVVVIADAQAAGQAQAIGEGERLVTLVGGKQDRLHGEPLSIDGIVEKISDGQYQISGTDHFAGLYGKRVDMGLCAVIRCQGVRILVTSRKTPPGDLNQLRSQGIEPTQQSILVVKSAVAFRGAYGPVAGKIIEVDTPGLCSSDLSRFVYRHLPRPIYPLDLEGYG